MPGGRRDISSRHAAASSGARTARVNTRTMPFGSRPSPATRRVPSGPIALFVESVWPAATPDLIRVTVVATGLGRIAAAPAARPREMGREGAARTEPPMRVVRRSPLNSSDYAALDRPTVQRQRAVGDGLRADVDVEDVLDIPAFLRRQAD